MNNEKLLKELENLISNWGERAENKIKSASRQNNEFEKRFIEYGAACIANCAFELKDLLISLGYLGGC